MAAAFLARSVPLPRLQAGPRGRRALICSLFAKPGTCFPSISPWTRSRSKKHEIRKSRARPNHSSDKAFPSSPPSWFRKCPRSVSSGQNSVRPGGARSPWTTCAPTRFPPLNGQVSLNGQSRGHGRTLCGPDGMQARSCTLCKHWLVSVLPRRHDGWSRFYRQRNRGPERLSGWRRRTAVGDRARAVTQVVAELSPGPGPYLLRQSSDRRAPLEGELPALRPASCPCFSPLFPAGDPCPPRGTRSSLQLLRPYLSLRLFPRAGPSQGVPRPPPALPAGLTWLCGVPFPAASRPSGQRTLISPPSAWRVSQAPRLRPDPPVPPAPLSTSLGRTAAQLLALQQAATPLSFTSKVLVTPSASCPR